MIFLGEFSRSACGCGAVRFGFIKSTSNLAMCSKHYKKQCFFDVFFVLICRVHCFVVDVIVGVVMVVVVIVVIVVIFVVVIVVVVVLITDGCAFDRS